MQTVILRIKALQNCPRIRNDGPAT